MRKYIKFKNKGSIKINNVILIVLFLISINVLILFKLFNKRMEPKLVEIAQFNVDKIMDSIITQYSLKEDYETIKDIVIINKNKNDEIIDVSFNLAKVYSFSSKLTDELENDLNNIGVGNSDIGINNEIIDTKQESFVMLLPLGVISKNAYFSSMGPKIPVKIKFLYNVFTNIETKIKDYGINNSLIEVYTTINISSLIITPVSTKRVKRSYQVLIASKIIEGKVPELYGGTIEKQSNIIKSK